MLCFPEKPDAQTEWDGKGLLNIPEELELPTDEEVENSTDEFIALLIEVMSRPIRGRENNGRE